jgi:hypothetical protein
MAFAKSIIKNVHQESVVKLTGTTADSGIINLAVDLPAVGQIVSGTPEVVITGIGWTGNPAAVITITRNAVIIATLPCTGSNYLDMSGQDLPPDNVQSTQNLTVSFAGGIGEVWIKMKKINGYATTIEPEQYGSYDNPSVAGS